MLSCLGIGIHPNRRRQTPWRWFARLFQPSLPGASRVSRRDLWFRDRTRAFPSCVSIVPAACCGVFGGLGCGGWTPREWQFTLGAVFFQITTKLMAKLLKHFKVIRYVNQLRWLDMSTNSCFWIFSSYKLQAIVIRYLKTPTNSDRLDIC